MPRVYLPEFGIADLPDNLSPKELEAEAWKVYLIAIDELPIAQHQVFLAPGPQGVDPVEKVEQLENLIDELSADKIEIEAARIEINRVLTSFSLIEWWGQFEELVSSESDFAREVRESYRESNQAEVVGSSPVTEEE